MTGHDPKSIPLGGACLLNKATGERYPLKQAVLKIGRDENNDMAIADDSYVSRNHAWLLHMRGFWWVEDLGSTNGTKLNGKALSERIQLSPGDAIKIGQSEFLFELVND